MKRFFVFVFALLFLVLPVLAEESLNQDDLGDLPKTDAAASVDLEVGSVDLTESNSSLASESSVSDLEIPVDAALGSLDLSGPIPVIILPAVESSGDSDEESPQNDFLEDESLQEEPSEPVPIPVIVVEEEPVYSVAPYAGAVSGLVIGDDPPANPLFYGSGWITGTDPSLGRVTIYCPIDYKSGVWGVDRSGYLYNVSAGSLSGYLSGVYNNSVTAAAFGYPRYRVYSGSTLVYVDLHLIPENSNMDISVDLVPRYTVDAFLPYIIILFLGGLIVCFMRRS